MPREVNAAALAIEANSEGTVYVPYRDPTGKLTVGRGHTGPDIVPGKTYTPAEIDVLSQEDMAKAAAFVESKVKVPLTDNEFSALAEFTFNVGIGNFAGSTLLRLLNRGDYAAVPAQLMRWTKGKVNGKLVVLPGLVTRRAHEAALFATPDTHTLAITPVEIHAPASVVPVAVQQVAPSLIERLRAWLHQVVNP